METLSNFALVYHPLNTYCRDSSVQDFSSLISRTFQMY